MDPILKEVQDLAASQKAEREAWKKQLDELTREGKEETKSLREALEQKIAESQDATSARLESQEMGLERVEAELAKARQAGGARDNLLNVIPERHRSTISMHEARGVKDPVRRAAVESFLKNHFRAQIASFGESDRKRCIEENALLEKVLSFGQTRASMSESTTSTGLAVVPTPVEAELLRIMADSAVVRPLAKKYTMTAPEHTVPSVASGVTTYVVSYLSDTNITQGDMTLGTVSLQSKVFVGYSKFGMDLLEDGVVGLVDEFFTLVGEDFGSKEDDYALEGTAGDPFEGLFTNSSVNEIEATSATATAYPSYSQIWQVVAKAAKRSTRTRGGSAFIMHPTEYALVMGQTSTSLPVFPAPSQAAPLGAEPMPLIGYPVFTTDQINIARSYGTSDGTTIYFGNFGLGMLFGDVMGETRFDISEHAHFQSGQIGARAIKRTAIKIGLPAAFTRLIKAKAA